MVTAAKRLAAAGWVLRSGGADGADSAFELGAHDVNAPMEIYLPWRGFNGRASTLHTPSALAFEIAAAHHPAWGRCSAAAQKLHARNVHQVLGADCNTPSTFILCWTPLDRLGGTGQAIRIASTHNVRVFNMNIDGCATQLREFLRTI
jgi:hypothetical protein